MAKFTANAVYNVKHSDGLAIIDFLKGETEDTEEEQKNNISFVSTPEVLPEGGDKTASITVTVTDEDRNPVKGAKVVFDASRFEFRDRNAQLSLTETTTDASGKAVVTYTTLAVDDKNMIQIGVCVYNDDPTIDEHKDYKIIAANQVAVVRGVVRNPYTGAPEEGVHISFMTSDTESIAWAETDDQGRYSVVVPIGTYRIIFLMKIIDQITVKASSPGQTYTIDANKGILKGVITGVSPGNTVMALDWSVFNPNNLDNHTLQGDIQSDGSFTIALDPSTYELFICGDHNPFITGVTVKSGQVTDIGTVKAR